VVDYIRWTRQTSNGWALSLLPFLTVLRTLDTEPDRRTEENIYTLF
jgi:hypothetical protein